MLEHRWKKNNVAQNNIHFFSKRMSVACSVPHVVNTTHRLKVFPKQEFYWFQEEI